MKKTRFSKIAALLLALTLAVGALLGVSVVANATTDGPTLGYANILWGDEIKFAFTIDNADENASLGIAMYAIDGENKVLKSVDFKAADGEVAYYTTAGIAAKDIDTVYCIAIVEGTAGDFEVVYEDDYSVIEYMTAMSQNGASAAQMALYEKVKAYNDAANAIFDK